MEYRDKTGVVSMQRNKQQQQQTVCLRIRQVSSLQRNG